jgi:hypothetical protein
MTFAKLERRHSFAGQEMGTGAVLGAAMFRRQQSYFRKLDLSPFPYRSAFSDSRQL